MPVSRRSQALHDGAASCVDAPQCINDVVRDAPVTPLRVLFASPEIYPLAKTGGLADVSAALPAALASLGVDVQLVMPAYPEAIERSQRKHAPVDLGEIEGLGHARLIEARAPQSGLQLWLVDCPSLFDRPGSPYADEQGCQWPDNAQRFALLCHVVARMALGEAGIDWKPDVVLLNDWHLGLVPALMAARKRTWPRSVMTIHNLAFQGLFPADVYPLLGLPPEWFTPDALEFYGSVSFLKAGICFADRVTTVSPRYAREILTPEFGCGLDGLLRTRVRDLTGILNGVDYERWTPEDRTSVPHPYSVQDISGKHLCKVALQREFGLEHRAEAPLVAFMSRFTEQKMADVLPEVAPALVADGAQFVMCGNGMPEIEQGLRALAARYPQRVTVRVGYEETLARRVLAGADMLAAPARFEPCGLTQLYAMRFGTIPVVRRVGGLADTVVGHAGRGSSEAERSTGFAFDVPTAHALAEAIRHACGIYRRPGEWKALQARAMRQDFRWRRPAERYCALYEEIARAGQQPRTEPTAQGR
jgi:starch synthase